MDWSKHSADLSKSQVKCLLTALQTTITAGNIVGNTLPSLFAHKIGHIKYQIIICAIIFTALVGAMAAVDGSNLAVPVALSTVVGITIGWLELVCLGAAPLMLDPKDIGVAGGVALALRNACSSLASMCIVRVLIYSTTATDNKAGSIYLTILSNRISTNLTKYVLGAAIDAGLPPESAASFLGAFTSGNATLLMAVPGVTPDIIQAAAANGPKAYFLSFQTVYYTSLAFGLLALIAAILLKADKIAEKMTKEIPRRLQGVQKTIADDDVEVREDFTKQE